MTNGSPHCRPIRVERGVFDYKNLNHKRNRKRKKMPKKKKSTGDWVERQNFRTPKTLKLRPVVGPIRTVEVNRKRRARLEVSENLSEENLESSGEDEFTFSQDRENEPSPPHRRSFTGDISLDSNQNNRTGVTTF